MNIDKNPISHSSAQLLLSPSYRIICWWHSKHKPNNNIASNLALIQAMWIVYCTLNSMWRGSMHYAKFTSNQPNVKLRCLKINQIFWRSVGANCAFTYLHKKVVQVHPQEMRNNGLIGLVLILQHLSYHHLSYRAFPITKEISRTRLNLSMWVSVGSFPIVIGYVSIYMSFNL